MTWEDWRKREKIARERYPEDVTEDDTERVTEEDVKEVMGENYRPGGPNFLEQFDPKEGMFYSPEEADFNCKMFGGRLRDWKDAAAQTNGMIEFLRWKEFNRNPRQFIDDEFEKAQNQHRLTTVHQEFWDQWMRNNK